MANDGKILQKWLDSKRWGAPDLAAELNLMGYNPNWYLFGSPCEGGKGNTGLTVEIKQQYFLPAPTRVKRDTLTKLWHRIVKVGLGFDVDLYALKHKGADDKIIAGVSLDALRHLYGHSSKQMTTIYAKEVLNIYTKEIQDNSPDF